MVCRGLLVSPRAALVAAGVAFAPVQGKGWWFANPEKSFATLHECEAKREEMIAKRSGGCGFGKTEALRQSIRHFWNEKRDQLGASQWVVGLHGTPFGFERPLGVARLCQTKPERFPPWSAERKKALRTRQPILMVFPDEESAETYVKDNFGKLILDLRSINVYSLFPPICREVPASPAAQPSNDD